MSINLCELIHLIKGNGAQLSFQGEKYNGNEIAKRAQSVAAYLENFNQNELLVAIYSENEVNLIALMLAVWHIGGTILPINVEDSIDSVIALCKEAKPQFLVSTERSITALRDALPNTLVLDVKKLPDDPSVQLKKEVSHNTIASILFSSGSTGKPKGIMHSYSSLNGFIDNLHRLLLLDSKTSYLVAQPMGHIGVIAVVMGVLKYGGHAILMEKFQIDEYMKNIQYYKPTHLNLHTPLFRLVADYPNLQQTWFKNIKVCFAAGDTMDDFLPEQFYKTTGSRLTTGYGSTEVGICLVNRNLKSIKKHSIGCIIPPAQVILRDESGAAISNSTVGEIWVKSPASMVAYWNDSVQTSKKIIDGWINTGDLARCDNDGNYWYFGRQSHAIQYKGKTIYPILIEALLFRHFKCKQAVVIINKIDNSAELHAFVQIDDQSLLVSKITHKINAMLPDWIKINKTHLTNNMPLNYTGKVDRHKLSMKFTK